MVKFIRDIAFALLFLPFILEAQVTILDFETPATSTSFTYFGSTLDGTSTTIVNNPAPGGINTSSKVLRMVKPANAQTWAGAYSNPNPATSVNLTAGGLIRVKFWTDHVGNLTLKLEESTNGGANWAFTMPVTTINQWVELVFDPTQPSFESGSPIANGFNYNKIVLFPDFGTSASVSHTFYIDDIRVTNQGTPPQPVNVTFRVNMTQYSGTVGTMYVSGSFNNWSGTANPMTDANNDGIYEATISLIPGSYEYKFTMNNWAVQEMFQAGTSCTVTNFGFTNRSLTVTSSTGVLPVVCWQSCSNCSTTPPTTYPVTFRVNMSQYTGTVGNMYVSGSFNGWSGTANPMSDANNDGIYEATINLLPGNYEYKFTMNNWADQEMFQAGTSCTVTNSWFTNRSLTVTSSTGVLPVVCWQSCTNCPTGPPPSYSVTFSVDMSQFVGTFTNVYVSGSFNNWSGNAWKLTHTGNGIYTGTWSVVEGNHEFKFTLDNWAQQEMFAEGTPCTVTNSGFTNRSLTVGANTTLPTVCWQSCSACSCDIPVYFTGTVTNTTAHIFWQPVSGAVSYRVRYRPVGAARWQIRNTTTASADLIHLHYGTQYEYHVKANCSKFGTKKNFVTSNVPACTTPPTTSVTTTSTTITINWMQVPNAVGYNVQYKKVGDPTFIVLNVPASASSRTITGLMPGTLYDVQVRARCSFGPTTFGVVSRVMTTYGFEIEELPSGLSVVPNPTSEYCRITGLGSGIHEATVLDAAGRVVLTQSLASSPDLYVGNLVEGLYLIVVNQEGQDPRYLRFVKK